MVKQQSTSLKYAPTDGNLEKWHRSQSNISLDSGFTPALKLSTVQNPD